MSSNLSTTSLISGFFIIFPACFEDFLSSDNSGDLIISD
jgi:hypothetical protein